MSASAGDLFLRWCHVAHGCLMHYNGGVNLDTTVASLAWIKWRSHRDIALVENTIVSRKIQAGTVILLISLHGATVELSFLTPHDGPLRWRQPGANLLFSIFLLMLAL